MKKPYITIRRRRIGPGYPAYVIAEIGINHNGRPDLALKMIKEARRCGADAVKVQIVDAARSYTKDSASYPIFKRIEFSSKEWERIVRCANKSGIDIFASFGHPEAIRLIKLFDFPAVKVSSSNLTNRPLLKAMAGLRKPVILATGLSYLKEVEEAVRFLEQLGRKELAILQCTSLYPAPFKDMNLRVMTTLSAAFGYPVGLSDHSRGTVCAVAAVALGAQIIEKHFTLDKTLPGPDHHFSADPRELTELVQAVRQAQAALGSADKKPVAAELPLRPKLRRSLVAARDIRTGELLSKKNVAVKRSARKGLGPEYYERILGKRAGKPIPQDAPIPSGLG